VEAAAQSREGSDERPGKTTIFNQIDVIESPHHFPGAAVAIFRIWHIVLNV
jgi:hypothetical protein